MSDYFSDWEWIPVERMPDGCNDVEVRFEDGRIIEYCSCDFWWTKGEKPTHFRQASVAQR